MLWRHDPSLVTQAFLDRDCKSCSRRLRKVNVVCVEIFTISAIHFKDSNGVLVRGVQPLPQRAMVVTFACFATNVYGGNQHFCDIYEYWKWKFWDISLSIVRLVVHYTPLYKSVQYGNGLNRSQNMQLLFYFLYRIYVVSHGHLFVLYILKHDSMKWINAIVCQNYRSNIAKDSGLRCTWRLHAYAPSRGRVHAPACT